MKHAAHVPSIVLVSVAANLFSNAGNRQLFPMNQSSSHPMSASASRIAREATFSDFLAFLGCQATDDESRAATLCAICNIGSRAELDRDLAAAARFETRIAKPYATWRRQ